MGLKAGYKGAVYIGAVKIGGANSWTYGGATRNMADIDEFSETIVKQQPLQAVGGDITINANYLLDSDEGQQLLQTRFDAATPITDIKLYTDFDSGVYMTPKAGSHCIVTNCNNVGDTSSGIGTITATLHVNGELEQIGAGVAVKAIAIGIHQLSDTEVSFIGELIDMGGEDPVDCYFEYGTTIAYGTDTSATEDVMDALGLFEGTSGLLVASTLYHWRIHCTFAGAPTVFLGEDHTFTTPA